MTAAQVQLAGKLADLGNGWLTTLGTWGNKGLGVALTVPGPTGSNCCRCGGTPSPNAASASTTAPTTTRA